MDYSFKKLKELKTFQNFLDESSRKPNKIRFDKGSYFYNRSMKFWLDNNSIEMSSTSNKGKSVSPERTLKNKVYDLDNR